MIKGLAMRGVLAGTALLALAACGQSGDGGTKAAGGAGGQSATIAEGTISDAMIDLSASESYGATSTVDDSALAPKSEGDEETSKPKTDDKKPADGKPKKAEAKNEAPTPAKSEDEAGAE